MLRRAHFSAFVVFATLSFTPACAGLGAIGPALQTANLVAGGVACGVAAAQGTPCTPTELLAQLSASQKALIEMAAAQASRGSDPAVIEALLKGLDASAATQRALAEQVIRLAERAGSAPTADVGAPPPAPFPPPSTPAPVAPPPAAPVPVPPVGSTPPLAAPATTPTSVVEDVAAGG